MIKKKEDPFYRDNQTLSYKMNPTKLQLWKKLKCFIYARVSDPKQVSEWNGAENQLISCEYFAKEMAFDIEESFKDEWVSWRLASRKGFDLMMKKLREANKYKVEIDYVIISEYSRFSRNVKLWVSEQMEDEIKETWCNIYFVRNKLSTGDKGSQMQLDQEKIKAKYESVENSERTIDRMTARMRLGYYVLPAPVWYTYEKVSTGHKKSQSYIQKKEGTAQIIKEWLEWFATWIYQTRPQLLKFFNDKLLKSNAHNSNIWKLRDSFISRILDIDKLYFYAGYIIYPKFWILEPIKAKHEAIISYDTRYKIKQKIDSKWNKKYGFRKDSSELYPLRWVLFCPHCNSPLTAGGSKWNWW
jgi:DNA invertase Pin-like site-specific DNA recombinase